MNSLRDPGRRVAIAVTCAALAAATAGCGDDDRTSDAAAEPSTTTATAPSTTVPASDPPTTAAPATDPPSTTALATSEDELSAQVEAVLTDAITSIRWDAEGVDIPPTAAVAALRIPGRDDVLVAVGENLDGTPTEADAPFFVAGLTESLVRSIAFQLVDEGVLDPTLTVDHWVATLPNADRVTLQMVIDDETGWSEYGPIEPDPVVTDFGRAWSLREAVELRATAMAALAEPGTRTNDAGTNEAVLGLVVEEVAGRPLAALVRDRVSEPAGLDDTGLLDWAAAPAGYRHGVFAFNGTPAETSAFDGTSFLTWNQATTSAVSTPTDLLDLLAVWATGELFTTNRAPAPHRYAPDPAEHPSLDFHAGLGVPFNGFCPCTAVDAGIEPTAIGRAPASLGTSTFLLRYNDGISVMLNVNSNQAASASDLEAVATAVHDLAAAAP